MKSDLQVKFLSYMTGRKKGEGFTLIELLVVIIIIGILAAIALPSFLNQANKAKQSEARQYVGALVRSQQAHYLENSEFASDIAEMGAPVASDTTNYEYKMTADNKAAASANAIVNGTSKKDALKSYVGGVFLGVVTATSEATTSAIVCENKAPGKTAAGSPTAPKKAGEAPECATTTIPLGKK
jgi:type IV pilus assembly protein PilA